MSMLAKSEKYNKEDLKKVTIEILETTKLLSMATIKENTSWINTAYFAYADNLNLYILTPPESQHGKNLELNSSVAVTIFDSHQDPAANKRGLQIFGTAKKASGKELLEGIVAYGKRFASFAASIKNADDYIKAARRSKVYVIQVKTIKIFDETTFGEEKWVTFDL